MENDPNSGNRPEPQNLDQPTKCLWLLSNGLLGDLAGSSFKFLPHKGLKMKNRGVKRKVDETGLVTDFIYFKLKINPQLLIKSLDCDRER